MEKRGKRGGKQNQPPRARARVRPPELTVALRYLGNRYLAAAATSKAHNFIYRHYHEAIAK